MPILIIDDYKAMNDNWQNALTDYATKWVKQPNKEQPCLIPLTQSSILEITGEEAESFLQNLLTNDVNQLSNNQGQLSGFCNPKGRLLALFWLIKHNDRFLALLPNDNADTLLKRLQMFKLRSKVTITDVSEQLAAFAVLSDNENKIETIQLSAPLTAGVVITEMNAITTLLDRQSEQDWQLCAPEFWDELTIEAGIPSVFSASKEQFTPQQLNLDLINGVSFSKGCYPGQEVVARLHYLGKPSRRLFLAEYTGEAPAPNQTVTDADGNTVGHIVCVSSANNPLMLISLKLSDIESDLSTDQASLKIIKHLAETA
jgi:hypothetical protein